jgi:hypothetical protein
VDVQAYGQASSFEAINDGCRVVADGYDGTSASNSTISISISQSDNLMTFAHCSVPFLLLSTGSSTTKICFLDSISHLNMELDDIEQSQTFEGLKGGEKPEQSLKRTKPGRSNTDFRLDSLGHRNLASFSISM